MSLFEAFFWTFSPFFMTAFFYFLYLKYSSKSFILKVILFLFLFFFSFWSVSILILLWMTDDELCDIVVVFIVLLVIYLLLPKEWKKNNKF